jgi:hypothetical protein
MNVALGKMNGECLPGSGHTGGDYTRVRCRTVDDPDCVKTQKSRSASPFTAFTGDLTGIWLIIFNSYHPDAVECIHINTSRKRRSGAGTAVFTG